ncbi:FAD-binding protein [Candidatus Bipolaricaulota bacterium]|nr:FAD-binding protein [Candidatus Bipolaricaulota bacterium]
MRLRIHQIVAGLDDTEADILRRVAWRLGCREQELDQLAIVRRSLDARHHDRPPYRVFTIEVEYDGTSDIPLAVGKIEVVEPKSVDRSAIRAESGSGSGSRSRSRPHVRPVVVGAGPAGLMAALELAEADVEPILIERGLPVEARQHDVEAFWRQGILNRESNVLYGEGGAGLFSDGKLTARIKDRTSIRRFLQVLVECGASPEILIDAEPHLGSDALAEIVPAIRGRIQARGGTVRFGTRLESFHIENGSIRGITISGDEMRTDACFLATGHSARDVYPMLSSSGVVLEPKPFAIGVRVEIPQHRIDTAQYGRFADHPSLRSASFRLTRKAGLRVRSCYSFCMCPGGVVIACASSDGMLTTNGMSFSGRAKPFGNAAFLVPVRPEDFGGANVGRPLAGVEFQRRWEQAAFEAGGGDFGLPAQRLTAFLKGGSSQGIPEERSCSRSVSADLRDVLPEFAADTLRAAIPLMLRELRGVRPEEVVLYAAETRSASPVRILRNAASGQSIGVSGLYPIGEGAGYAGGIVSSAVDGQRAAGQLLRS